MSHTTETFHVRGVRRSRVIAAITQRMKDLDFVAVTPEERAQIERTDAGVRRIALRRDGAWCTLADAAGFDARRADASAQLDEWAAWLSRVLERSVLALWTWDGEASVRATRWKHGNRIGVLSLLDDAFRGDDGRAYAPAKVFRPWLRTNERAEILARGIKLATPTPGSTGDAELDVLLEGFDEADEAESYEDDDDDAVFVSEGVSVAAIGAAIGMRDPFLNPWMLKDDDEELLFRRRNAAPRARTRRTSART